METKVYYRVRPEYSGFSHQDFEVFEDALKKANERNELRLTDLHGKNTVYKGDNCILQKVTVTVESITF